MNEDAIKSNKNNTFFLYGNNDKLPRTLLLKCCQNEPTKTHILVNLNNSLPIFCVF